MPSANIEAGSQADRTLLSPLQSQPRFMQSGAAAPRRNSCCSWLGNLMWRLINTCFRSSAGQQEQASRPRPVLVTDLGHHYQAPVVTPSPRASGSVSSGDEEPDCRECGTLLPKRRTPEPGSGAASSGTAAAAAVAASAQATSAAAAAAAAAAAVDVAPEAADAPDVQRHRRTGSDGARLHVEGVRARVLMTTAAAAKGKFGTCSEAEFNAVAELLGPDADGDLDDFCPTCLEAYTDDNPKIFTRCGHSFHMQCIYAWLERKSTCPLCESPMDLQDDILL